MEEKIDASTEKRMMIKDEKSHTTNHVPLLTRNPIGVGTPLYIVQQRSCLSTLALDVAEKALRVHTHSNDPKLLWQEREGYLC